METLSGKLLTALLSLFLLLYVGYQGYRYYYSPIKTETVLGYTVQDTRRVKGLIVRDEAVLQQQPDGVVAYYNDDGVKVARGTPVAEVYANAEDVTNKRRAKELETELAHLKGIQNPGNNYYLNSEAISKQINENLYDVIATNESRNVLEISSQKAELLTNLNKKQLATGVITDFSQKIAALENEKEQLESTVSGSSQVITAEAVGYFSSYSDGLEGALTTEAVAGMSVEQLQGYIDAEYEQDSTKLGKLISQKTWYFITLIPADEAESLREDTKLKIDFGITSFREVPAVITELRHDEGEKNVIAVMSCDYMCPQLTRLRNPWVQLNFEVYTGLKIPSQAVRFVNNQRGVYVNTGSEIRFKTIDVIYEGTGYVLSAIDEAKEEQVQWFEDIVVKGTNLEDGKAIE